MGLAGNLASNNSSLANLGYAGQANQNNAVSGLFGSLMGAATGKGKTGQGGGMM
jgi:hypothetical protein